MNSVRKVVSNARASWRSLGAARWVLIGFVLVAMIPSLLLWVNEERTKTDIRESLQRQQYEVVDVPSPTSAVIKQSSGRPITVRVYETTDGRYTPYISCPVNPDGVLMAINCTPYPETK